MNIIKKWYILFHVAVFSCIFTGCNKNKLIKIKSSDIKLLFDKIIIFLILCFNKVRYIIKLQCIIDLK